MIDKYQQYLYLIIMGLVVLVGTPNNFHFGLNQWLAIVFLLGLAVIQTVYLFKRLAFRREVMFEIRKYLMKNGKEYDSKVDVDVLLAKIKKDLKDERD